MKSAVSKKISIGKQRLDIWLWVSRFYKTRKLACDAVVGGHIKINGQRCKPGRFVKAGESILIKKNEQIFDIEIRGLSKLRLSASLADRLYHETEENRTKREKTLEMKKQHNEGLVYEKKYPDKRQRKKLIRLKQAPFY